MTYLLDVNVLIALLDKAHVAHKDAQDWFEDEGHKAWATCAITENGFLRIVGGPKYRPAIGSPADVVPLLTRLHSLPGHRFWPDDFSLVSSPIVDARELRTSGQITDTYLLALAVLHGGRLATFDRRLSVRAVRGGRQALHVIASTASSDA